MKKFIMLLSSTALVACLFLSSCTKTPTTASIVGKWKFNKEIAQLIMDGKVMEEEVLYGASLNGLDMYFEFMSDNTFNSLGTMPGETDMSGSGTYSLFDNKLVLTYKDNGYNYTESFEIESCTSSQLVFKEEERFKEAGGEYMTRIQMYFDRIN